MKTKNYLRKELPILILILLPVLYILIVKDQLNSFTQIYWLDQKQSSTWISLLVLIGLNIVIYVLMLLVRRIDPKKDNYELFKSAYYRIRFIISLFLSVLTGLFITAKIGVEIDEIKIVRILTFVLLALTGNYIYNVKPNWFIGFRTPWTLDNEMVWRKTHHLGAKIMIGFSIFGIAISFIPQPETMGLIIFLAMISIMVTIPIIYSFRLHKKSSRK